MRRLSPLIFLSVFLVGCGGGGGGGQKTSVPPASSEASTSVSTSSSSSSSSSSISSSVVSTSSSTSSSSSSAASSIPFAFMSDSFVSGAKIPIKYSCFGGETSPHLQWDVTSSEIKSFALIMEDYDAIALVGHPYVHWNIFNIPADTRVIAEGATLRAMPMGSVEGVNDDGVSKYAGPCPPEGTGTHRYYFALYALNKENLGVNVNRTIRRNEFELQYAGSIIQKVEISGSYFYK